MLLNIAYILIFGAIFGKISELLKLPDIIGFVFCGIFLNSINLLEVDAFSADLRTIALVIILLRASLAIDFKKLAKMSKTALLLSFVPAIIEILALVLLSVLFFNVDYSTAFLIGTTVAAVSPAIIVPRMLKLQSDGTHKTIPELLLTAVSLDDIFIFVLFYSFLNGSTTGLLMLPITLFFGILAGLLCAFVLFSILKRTNVRANVTLGVLLSFAFILLHFENKFHFSALLAILTIGIFFRKKMPYLSNSLSRKLDDLWSVFSIILFVLVGAKVDLQTAFNFGFTPILLIIFALCFRLFATFICLIKTDFTFKEKLFCTISFIPKATVQATLGSIPLSLGLPYGDLILTISVLSILITAPLGAILIDNSKLLQKD